MATRRPRGGRRSWFRGRSAPYRRPRAHLYSCLPPRNATEAVDRDSSSSSDAFDFLPLHNTPNPLPPQSSTANNSTDLPTFKQPLTTVDNVTSPPPRQVSPKPLMLIPTQLSSPDEASYNNPPPHTGSSSPAAVTQSSTSVSVSVSDDAIEHTDGNVYSPTDQYLYGLDSDTPVFEDSNSTTLLGKRKGHPQSDELYGEGVNSEGGEEVVADKQTPDRNKAVESPVSVPTVTTFSQEEMMEVNKRAIGVVGLITKEQFLCNLCLAQLNSRKNLQKHIMANEHIRRISCLLRDDLEKAHRFCKVCYVKCLNDEVYSQHLKGKKHLKNVHISQKIKSMDHRPVGPLLEQLLKEEVVEEGDGLSMGLSPSMMKFFTLQGPFIGLQYAEEVGIPNDVNPKYNCTLCKIMTDAGNHYLHFTSSTHRMNVLKQDYPEKHQQMRRLMASLDKKSDVSSKLKGGSFRIFLLMSSTFLPSLASISATMSFKPKTSGFVSSGSSSGQPSLSSLSSRGRGSTFSSRGRGWSSWNKGGTTTQQSYSSDTPPFTPHTQRGGHQERGRARGGYNRGRGHGFQKNFQTPTNSNYLDFSKPSGSNGATSFTGVSGGLNPSGYQSYQQPVHVQQQTYGQHSNEYAPKSVASNQPPPFQQIQAPQVPQPLQPPQFPQSFTSQTTPQPIPFSSPSFHLPSSQAGPFHLPPTQPAPSLSSPPAVATHGQWSTQTQPPPTSPAIPLQSPSLTSPSFPQPPLQDPGNSSCSSRLYPSSSVMLVPPGTDRTGQYGGNTSVFPGQQFGGRQFSGSRSDGTSASGGVSGNESHLYGSIQKLANAQIENEDDAEKALQLSSALTQALLAYRIKKVSSANNPISSLLNTLHAVRATPSQYPQQQQQQQELNPNLHMHKPHTGHH